MQRRAVLQGLGLPAVVGLSGCAVGGAPALLDGGAISAAQVWGLLPASVQEQFRRNPALADPPPVGIQRISSGSPNAARNGQILGDWQLDQAESLVGVTSGHRVGGHTLLRASCELLQLTGHLVVAKYSTTNIRGTDDFTYDPAGSFVCTDVTAEGSLWPLRTGASRRVSLSTTTLDQNARPTGATRRLERTTTVRWSISQIGVWSSIALGQFRVLARPWMLTEPSFLMGVHHQVTTLESATTGWEELVSDVYGLPVLGFHNGTFTPTMHRGVFGHPDDTPPRLAGERLTLSAAGQQRLAEARIALEAEIARIILRAPFSTAAQRSAALPYFQRGQQLWQARDWAAAATAFSEGIALDGSSAAARMLYADAIRRAAPRPSARAIAADRLARVNYIIADALDPEGESGRAARQALNDLSMV